MSLALMEWTVITVPFIELCVEDPSCVALNASNSVARQESELSRKWLPKVVGEGGGGGTSEEGGDTGR